MGCCDGGWLLPPLPVSSIHRFRTTWWIKLVIAFALVCAFVAVTNNPFFHLSSSITVNLIFANPLVRLFEFVVGMTTALLWGYLAPRARLTRGFGTIVEMAAIATSVAAMWHSTTWANDIYASLPWIQVGGHNWLADGGFVCIPFAALILVMALEQGSISRLLSLSFPILLGEISYALYLLHTSLIRWYVLHAAHFRDVPRWLTYTIFWAVALVSSYVVWTVIECPTRRFINGFPARLHGEKGAARASIPKGQTRTTSLAGISPCALSRSAVLLGPVAGDRTPI